MSKLANDRATRMLNDLLTVPGNNVCADCKEPSPRWASYNLGIFLCMNCASIHRKLGTHISKVKSLHMDSWTRDQIEAIRVTGNVNANAIYNPKDVEVPVVMHDNAARDSELEKYIRNKYQFRKFMNMRDERIEAGRSKARELLTVEPPPRSSSSTSISSRPRAASPALTTKSPAPAASPVLTTKSPAPTTSRSPAPPTPSPSLPESTARAAQPSPQPPLQMLAPSQPPLQMLSPSFQPTFTQPMYTGAMPTMATGMSGLVSLPGTNPVWQDMAALQNGPALPSFQQQPLAPGITYGATMPIQGMNTGHMGQMLTSPMASSQISSFQASPSPYLQTGVMSALPLQTQYTQVQASLAMQQMQQQQQQQQMQQQQIQQIYQQQQQPQPLYVSNGVAIQSQMQMMPTGANTMMWTQGGFAPSTQGQWQG